MSSKSERIVESSLLLSTFFLGLAGESVRGRLPLVEMIREPATSSTMGGDEGATIRGDVGPDVGDGAATTAGDVGRDEDEPSRPAGTGAPTPAASRTTAGTAGEATPATGAAGVVFG